MIEKLNNYCDKVFVITIKRLKREEHFKRELDGLDYEIFYGVDGEELTDYDDYVRNPNNLSGHLVLNRPNVGCSRSHLNLYKKIIDDNIERTLVLEDDIIVQSSINQIDDYFSQVPDKYDVLYLGFINKHRNFDLLPRNYSRNIFKMDNSNFDSLEGTSSLIITKDFASRIYDFNSKYTCTADGAYSEMLKRNNLTYYAFVPQIMVQKF